ncbi:potassium channel protein [Leptolyngbya sp. O-77]|uniref:potassium channel protein n=1 Tax=Leptolyngbya sp. O-77 TaxID=1080068 RepID=UPI00074D48D6|nr:potassium channel protein [Leptolyngbya sp. O-77]BAU41865.1 Voltage-gated potassium channel Kch [Leptolyngbya sp. O-77]
MGSSPRVDRFLVCGLGSLGQYCVYHLQRFATEGTTVYVTAIDRQRPEEWEVENLTDLLAEDLLIGDCRDEPVLLKAGVQQCRAALIVTSNETVNIEAAIAIRQLNPDVRLVVRSSRQSLNELLKLRLGNFNAYDPMEMPAFAFAMAGLQVGLLGSFNIGDTRLQVVEQTVQPRDPRFDDSRAVAQHKKSYRLLSHRPQAEIPASPNRAFYHWQIDTRIQAGDTIAYIEIADAPDYTQQQAGGDWRSRWRAGLQAVLKEQPMPWFRRVQMWMQANRTRPLVAMGLVTALVLWVLGATMLKMTVPDLSWTKAIASGAVLLLGGYGDVFGGLENDPVPGWVYFVSLLITIISLLFVLGVVGIIADNLLSARFSFLQRRPPMPKQGHVVMVGLGRVGQQVATWLQTFRQPFIVLTDVADNLALFPKIPIIVGNPIQQIHHANIETAKSLVVVTDDQILNLEVALTARELTRQQKQPLQLVIRSYNQRFSTSLATLIPNARVMAVSALAAEAFVGSAFGENILSLFRLNEQTILVTEFLVEAGDTLVGKLLSQVSYGYGVVPIFYERNSERRMLDNSDSLMPSETWMLQAGDRLIVLSTIDGLRRIERGQMRAPRPWRLSMGKPLNQGNLSEIGITLHRISGLNLKTANAFARNLPGTIYVQLYDYPAHHLLTELRKLAPDVTLVPIEEAEKEAEKK